MNKRGPKPTSGPRACDRPSLDQGAPSTFPYRPRQSIRELPTDPAAASLPMELAPSAPLRAVLPIAGGGGPPRARDSFIEELPLVREQFFWIAFLLVDPLTLTEN